MDKRKIEGHYDRHAVANKNTNRRESASFSLFQFNNWVKATMISRYAIRYDNVLDLGGGRFGDIQKWMRASYQGKISRVVIVDVSAQSIREALNRYNSMVSRYDVRKKREQKPFRADFYVADCFEYRLREVFMGILPKAQPTFHLVSAQFCIHYAFETEQRARVLLKNVSEALVPGGLFIGTIPDSDIIRLRIKNADCTVTDGGPLQFGNEYYKIVVPQESTLMAKRGMFGVRYQFFLRDAVEDCVEYLVHFPTFQEMAREEDLILVRRMNFHDHYQSIANKAPDGEEMAYLGRMLPNGIVPLLWDVAQLYTTFVFQKRGTRALDTKRRRMNPYRTIRPEEIHQIKRSV